jgi:transposase-like protein
MTKKSRRRFTPEQKAAIVRRPLVDKVPISDLCDEYKIQPSMIYTWQKAVVDDAARAFDGTTEQKGASSREAELARRILREGRGRGTYAQHDPLCLRQGWRRMSTCISRFPRRATVRCCIRQGRCFGGVVSVKVASGIFVHATPPRTHILQSLSEPDDALQWAQGSEDNETSGLQG